MNDPLPRADGGYLMQAQHLAVHDGDGIRTVLFLAGCPLRCRWCANPEGFETRSLTAYLEENCTHCGLCTSVCPIGLPPELNEPAARAQCTGCGTCVSVCPSHAREQMVHYESVDSIVHTIERQLLFFRQSGGGVTFSGGEATMQPAFLRSLTASFLDLGVHMAIETCGHFTFSKVCDILKNMDFIFMDLKLMDDEKHRFFTGASNEQILDNIRQTASLKIPMTIRVPLIQGVNDDEENITATARFVRANAPHASLELLPYHKLGLYKYKTIGRTDALYEYETPSDEKIARLRALCSM